MRSRLPHAWRAFDLQEYADSFNDWCRRSASCAPLLLAQALVPNLLYGRFNRMLEGSFPRSRLTPAASFHRQMYSNGAPLFVELLHHYRVRLLIPDIARIDGAVGCRLIWPELLLQNRTRAFPSQRARLQSLAIVEDDCGAATGFLV